MSIPVADDGGHANAEVLLNQAFGIFGAAALRIAAVHRIADHLAEGPLGPEELAGRTGTHAPSLYRVLRFLASIGIFAEDDQGAFHLTPPAELLRTGVPGSLLDLVTLMTADLFRLPAAGIEETVRSGVPSFEGQFGSSFFTHLKNSPDAGALFDRGMAAFSVAYNNAIAEVYNFPRTGTVVDVGGGHGGLLSCVLQCYPGLSGVLLDQQWVVKDHILDTVELAGRWRVETGDFFSAVPEGGDIYFLKHILHDWSDEDCLRILTTCRRAMRPGARLLIVDAVLAPGNDQSIAKVIDVVMLNIVNGKERTRIEFNELLTAAGFEVSRVCPLPPIMSIVEAYPA